MNARPNRYTNMKYHNNASLIGITSSSMTVGGHPTHRVVGQGFVYPITPYPYGWNLKYPYAMKGCNWDFSPKCPYGPYSSLCEGGYSAKSFCY